VSACTVVIPTRDRPGLVREAVDSALGQTVRDTRILVVDDGSVVPVVLPEDPRLEVVRHLRPRGVAAARNLGISLATSPYVAFLDDDDVLRPHFVEASLEHLERVDLPEPVAALSAVAVLDERGEVVETRLPPRARPRGQHFSLEPVEEGRGYFSKQTLLAPREALLTINGLDERFRSRVVTELFWRLNPVCSLAGFDEVTYELRAHAGPRISTDRRLRQRSFRQLLDAHPKLLADHPEGHARLLAEHARNSLSAGQPVSALRAALTHARIAPGRTRSALREACRVSAS
jgi:hypothetical protein